MPYAVGRTGLIHDADCKVLGAVAWTAPDRVAALRVGHRLAKCCLRDRIAPRAGAGALPRGWLAARRRVSLTPAQPTSRVRRLD